MLAAALLLAQLLAVGEAWNGEQELANGARPGCMEADCQSRRPDARRPPTARARPPHAGAAAPKGAGARSAPKPAGTECQGTREGASGLTCARNAGATGCICVGPPSIAVQGTKEERLRNGNTALGLVMTVADASEWGLCNGGLMAGPPALQ